MSRKTTIIIVILLSGLGIFYLASPAPLPVDVTTAETGEVKAFVEERAKTTLPRVYRIAMPLNGRVLPIKVSEDQKVTQGQVVAVMETFDLEAEVAKAQNEMKCASGDIYKAQGRLQFCLSAIKHLNDNREIEE